MKISEAFPSKLIDVPPPAGHNRPPSMVEFAREAGHDLSLFLASTPVIDNHDMARNAGLLIERTRKTLQDMDAERTKKVKPLNDQVAEINADYRSIRESVERILLELRKRLTDFAAVEELKRLAAAEAARKAAEEAERLAREAEAREREAIENASLGECADVGGAILEADQQFAAYAKAERAAAVAEKAVPVRIASGLGGRALSMRSKETLILSDPMAALAAIGLTEKIREAILSGARDYRRLRNELPPGVTSQPERSI